MAPNQKDFTIDLVRQIQDINGNPAFSALEKKEAIANLSGASKESMYDYLNQNFRVGPDLADSIKAVISKNRPVGGPTKPTPSIKPKKN